MGLVGSLEDLGLADILQIVSLARKSGVLNLSWKQVKGKIIFKDGTVISALNSEIRKNLGLLLVEEGILKQEQLENLVEEAKKRGEKDLLIKSFVVENFGIDAERIEEIIKREIENVVFSFFTWPEGNFSFELMEVEDELRELKNPWRQFILDVGLSPQYLAMEGSRIQDEKKRESYEPVVGPPPPLAPVEISDHEFKAEQTREEDFSSVAEFLENYEKRTKKEPPVKEAPSASELMDSSIQTSYIEKEPEKEIPKVEPQEKPLPSPEPEEEFKEEAILMLVDDDTSFLKAMAHHFIPKGYRVLTFEDARSFLDKFEEIISRGEEPIVVADLIMRGIAKQSLLGGLELLSELRTRFGDISFILVTDYENVQAEKEADRLKVDFFFIKPKSSQIDEEFKSPEVINFVQILDKALINLRKTKPKEREPKLKVEVKDELFNLVEELRKEMGEEEFIIPETEPKPKSRGLDMLKTMINELNDPSSNGQITLLVLRFASELMNRAVIFVMGKDQVAGLGQFGIELNGLDPEKQVRKMRIPLNEPSIFQEVAQKRMPLKKPLKPTKWNQYLIEKLGGKVPKEVFVAPIISSGRIAAILYGDNLPEEKEIGDTESLEIFLVQAGLAMEKALLERRIQELRASRATNPDTG